MTSMKHKSLLATALGAALIAPAAFGQDDIEDPRPAQLDPLFAPVVIEGMGHAFAPLFSSNRVVTQQLIVTGDGATRFVQIQLDDRTVELELHPFTMRSPDCQLVIQEADGSFRKEPMPPVKTYRGTSPGNFITVTATVDGDKVWAVIRDQINGIWGVEPVSEQMPGMPADWHVVYHTADNIPADGECGVDTEQFLQPAVEPIPQNQLPSLGALAGGASDGRTQLAFDCDGEFYANRGNSTDATVRWIEMNMNEVGEIYRDELSPDICYEITGFVIRTNAGTDPYVSTNANTMLCEFSNEWDDNIPDASGSPYIDTNPGFSFSRDQAHMMTGKNMDGSTIGIAWVGAICDTVYTNCNGGVLHHGVSMEIANLTNQIQLMAHEMGHNWNCCHCNQSGCTGGAADGDCGIMNSFVNGSLTFGARSTTAINNYRTFTTNCLGDCEGTLYIDNNGSVTFGCAIQIGDATFPYCTAEGGFEAFHSIDGTVRVGTGNYIESGIPVLRRSMLIRRWASPPVGGTAGNPVLGGS